MSVRKSESLGQKIIYLVDLLDEIVFQMIYNVQKVFLQRLNQKTCIESYFCVKALTKHFDTLSLFFLYIFHS